MSRKEEHMRNSFLEVNLNNVSYNIQQIKKFVGDNVTVMPVIKANAYGLGAEKLKNILEKEKISKVAVAIVDEAIKLRKAKFNMDIIVLNELLEDETEQIVDYGLTAGVSVFKIAEKINEYSKKKGVITKIHIEIDTGMGRVGLKIQEVLSFVKNITSKLTNLEIEGIYTHLSSADSSTDFTKQQISKFETVRKQLVESGFKFKYYHISASGGILKYPEAHYNMVRPGIIIYGYLPNENMKDIIDLKPTTKLKSSIVFIKDVEKGEPISYGRTYITSKKTKVATIPIGYADGVGRSLSNKGNVIIHGKLAPIIGNICMDNFMVDITDIPDAKIGDEVILWDNDKIKIEDIADVCGTINYEILCGVQNRIPRKYII
jgi:alanine racemase